MAAIQAVDGNALFFCEGLSFAGDLDGTLCQGTIPQVNQLQYALGDRSGYGLFAQDWTGVSNPALLEALQAIRRPTTGPGVQAAGRLAMFD